MDKLEELRSCYRKNLHFMTGKFYLNAIFFDEIDNQPSNIKK